MIKNYILIWNINHQDQELFKTEVNHSYTGNFVQRPSKTSTPGKNPRKKKLSLKGETQIFFQQHRKIILLTLIGKIPKKLFYNKLPQKSC